MQLHSWVSSLGAATLLTAAVTAQSVYIVDRLNRPGTNFLDVPAAEAAAQHGDTLILRSDASPYTPVTTAKGLQILGDPSGLASFVATGPGFVVSGLPAGRDFVMRNCELFGLGTGGARVRIDSCLGRVHLQQVRATIYSGLPAIEVIASTAVTLRECEGTGSPALRTQNATLAIMDSRFNGSAASAQTSQPAFPGMALQDSSVQMSDVQAFGGLAAGTFPPAPAAVFVGSSVSATGLAGAARFTAGFYGSSGLSTAVPAIAGQTSLFAVDPEVLLNPHGGAAAVVGVVAVTTSQAALSVTGNSVFFVGFDGGANSAQLTLIGFPADPLALPGVGGRLWLGPTDVLVVPGVLGGFSGFAEFALPRATTLVMQVLNLQAGALELTAPAVVTSRL